MSPRKILISFLLSMNCFCLLACSSSVFHHTSPEVKQVLIGVTNRYLTVVANGDEHSATQMIYWPDFSESGKFTTAEYHRQFESMRNRWNASTHPLASLVVVDAVSDGNSAKVTLQKDPKLSAKSKGDSPDIWVKLIWAGRGWIVSEDSLFGTNKYLASLSKSQG